MGFNVNIFTLYPEMFPGALNFSLSGKALDEGKWHLNTINIRDYAADKHKTVDDTPFGGGAGMVLKPDVLDAAIAANPHQNLVFLTPRGEPLKQDKIKMLANLKDISIICGHFEGVDERFIEKYKPMEFSIGDYILSGGEIAAFVLLDAIIRTLPDVIGNNASLQEESFECGLLEYPQYTRPAVWEGSIVPSVLTSGNHQEIAKWRKQKACEITKSRRSDLWELFQKKFEAPSCGN